MGELSGTTFALDSVLAWVYLVVMGSLIGFTAYAWLLRVAPISLVVTHQYVNPLVAIALGMLFLGERPSPWSLAGPRSSSAPCTSQSGVKDALPRSGGLLSPANCRRSTQAWRASLIAPDS